MLIHEKSINIIFNKIDEMKKNIENLKPFSITWEEMAELIEAMRENSNTIMLSLNKLEEFNNWMKAKNLIKNK
jgi:SMC interacting uncharacterized protein involved in chromosome segregation